MAAVPAGYGPSVNAASAPVPIIALFGDAGEVARWSVIGAGIASTVLLLVWFVATSKHPEHAADGPAQMQATARKPDGVARRPAGPAAENMDPDPPGGRTPPAPWPGSSPVPPDTTGAPS